MNRCILASCLLALALAGPSAWAQDPFADSTSSSAWGYGGEVLLTNSGFGLGGYLARGLWGSTTMTLEANVGSAKDEREVAFFDRFGQRDVPNKANYLIEIPFRIGLERRFFQDKIEDNFRPYLHVSGGPVVGWKYPYYDDENGNGVHDDEEPTFGMISGIGRGGLEPGVSGAVAIGANFGQDGGLSQGVRMGFRFSWYRNRIDLLDRHIKEPVHTIGTPYITVYFGRLGR